MAITTYAELQTAISNYTHRSDLTSTQVQEFISLAEADLKVRAELTQWDTETTITLTSGTGSLPTGCDSIITARVASQNRTLVYKPPTQFKDYIAINNDPVDEPVFYTIIGNTIEVTPSATNTLNVLCTVRFTSLSASNTTNNLLDLFPDAYLHGSMMYAYIFLVDDAAAQKHAQLFEAAIQRIRKYFVKRKYPAGLQMRAA